MSVSNELSIPERVEKSLIDAAMSIAEYRRTVGGVDDDRWLTDYTERLLHLANDLIVTAEETLRAADEPAADVLVDFLDGPAAEMARNLSQLRTTLEGTAHDAIEREGEVPLPDGRKAYATFKRSKVRTDGRLILSRLVARCADDFVGHPPSDAEMVANVIDSAAGITNASHKWRKSGCAVHGIQLEDFVDSEPGAKTVGFTQPKQTQRDAA